MRRTMMLWITRRPVPKFRRLPNAYTKDTKNTKDTTDTKDAEADL